MTSPLTAHTVVRCDLPTLWRLTQDPASHVRWDARFSDIEYLPKETPDAPQRFRYATRLGFGLAVTGWGQTVADRESPGGVRGSALRFGSDDPTSLIREGAGSWACRPHALAGFVHFRTSYDYTVRFGAAGRAVDRIVFRPLMQWATRWSFDRLRLWVERGLEPEVALRLWLVKVIARTALALVWVYEGLVPKLLYVTQSEIDLVARSRLYWPTPAATLTALAVGEILGGLWLLSGKAERAAATLSLFLTITLGTLCAVHEPALLYHPFGGLSKNLCLIACALVVYLLSRVTPRASRSASGPLSPPRERVRVRGNRRKSNGERMPSDGQHLPLTPALSRKGRGSGGAPAQPVSPFAAALSEQLDHAAPLVREHFLHAHGVRHYRGVMTRVWRRRDSRGRLALPALWLARFARTLFPDTGEHVPFELEHAVERLPDGRAIVRFVRTFHFPRGPRRFAASLTYDPARRCLSDRLGRGGLLEVELHPWVEAGELHLRSGRQFFRLGHFKLPIPHWLAGHARVREYEGPANRLGIEVVISNPLLGDFFGYEGTFARDPHDTPKAPAPAHRQWKGNPSASPTADNPRAAGKVKWLTRAALFLVATLGTAAYAASFRLLGTGHGVGAGFDPAATAAVVGVAAATAWPLFGLALLRLTRGGPGAWHWADACLRTMAFGVPVLCAAALWNASLAATGAKVPAAAFLAAHAAWLAGANVLMGAVFVRHAARLGLRPRAAVGAWVLALDAPFLALLVWFMAFFDRTGVV